MSTIPDLNLSGLKVGDEVVTLTIHDGLQVGGNVYVVREINADRVIVRRPDRTVSSGGWQIKNGGKVEKAMFGPEFYYSANPAHIAIAKEWIKQAKARKEEADRAFAALMEIARPIGEELGDGWDGEEGYRRETAAQTLAANLTPEQMATLRGWLKMG